MSFYENFSAICKNKGIARGVVCVQCGLSESSHNKWKTSSPKGDTIVKLAECLKVTTDSLLLGDKAKPTLLPSDEISLLKCYRNLSDNKKDYILNLARIEASKELTIETIEIQHGIFDVSAGYGVNIWETNAFEPITIERTFYSAKADFCLTISGDSMQPDYNDGDVVLIKAQPDIEIGQVGIFTQGNKGYIKEKGKNRLISLNPEYPDIIPSEYDDIICRGLVIGKL